VVVYPLVSTVCPTLFLANYVVSIGLL